ncbi:hypothetical protein KCU95_g80, partial [Aureobasidium melanogenum]
MAPLHVAILATPRFVHTQRETRAKKQKVDWRKIAWVCLGFRKLSCDRAISPARMLAGQDVVYENTAN